MEALYFGIPVMATEVGGVPELVSRQTGYLLPAHPTPREMAQQLVNFMQLASTQRTLIR
jgi:glycosyltransferase involved in cell wall biosynthesis